MQLKRRIINECKGQPQRQKVVAMALFIKSKLGRSSMMRNYTINNLHTITGISATTLHKYIPIMVRLRLVQFFGDKKQHFAITNLASHTDGRNINVDKFCFDSFKDVCNSLRAFLALFIQARKDFIRRTIQTVANPKNYKEHKAARKTMKRLVKQGIVASVNVKYKELGISYKRIAKELGMCMRTAQNIIEYALEKNWAEKHKHIKAIDAPNINYFQADNCTYTTKNYICIVYANTYTLNPSLASNNNSCWYI